MKNRVVIQGGPKRRPQLTAVIGNFNDIIDKMSLTFISLGENFVFSTMTPGSSILGIGHFDSRTILVRQCCFLTFATLAPEAMLKGEVQ